MTKPYSLFLALIITLPAYSQVGVNNDGSYPDPSAMLDVKSLDKGILIPRVTLTGTTDPTTIPIPATGLLIYNTATSGTGTYAVTPGFYYNSGTPQSVLWSRLVTMSGGGSGTGWLTGGNLGTASGSDFIGTVDNQALDIRTFNTIHGRFTTNGQLEFLNNGQSVFLGEGAGLSDNLATNKNVFVGYRAGYLASTSKNNTAIGHEALRGLQNSQYNTAIGSKALYSNYTANGNTAVGFGALYSNNVSYNTAVGDSALYSNMFGGGNTAVGSGALKKNVQGADNTAVGTGTLLNNLGSNNTALGRRALYLNAAGNDNTAVGRYALFSNIGGSYNTSVGNLALNANTEGQYNSAIGTGALGGNTTGGENIALGADALASNQTGSGNIALGKDALFGNTEGNSNIAIGKYAGYYETGNSNFYLDNQLRSNLSSSRTQALIYGNFDTIPEHQFLHLNANVGINTSSLSSCAAFEISSQSKGFLPPRILKANRPPVPVNGLMIFQTDDKTGLYFYNNNAWNIIGSGANDFWQGNGQDIYFDQGKVAIGNIQNYGHALYVRNYFSGKAAVFGYTADYENFAHPQTGGLLGVLGPGAIGVPGGLNSSGVLGIKYRYGPAGSAVTGWNMDTCNYNYGGTFTSNGNGLYTNYGISAQGKYAAINYGGTFLASGDSATANYGVYAGSEKGALNFGGSFQADGQGSLANYGVYSIAKDGLINYGGMFLTDQPNVGTNCGIWVASKKGLSNYAGRFTGRVLIEGLNGHDNSQDSAESVLKSVVTLSSTIHAKAIEGLSSQKPGYGTGVYGAGGNTGVLGAGIGNGATGWVFGISGTAGGSGGTRVGVYGTASGGTHNYAGYFSGDLYTSDYLLVGTATKTTGYKVCVNGGVACNEVLIEEVSNWPDYVFEPTYDLKDLDDLKSYIRQEKHLPGIPSSDEISKTGLKLGEMQKSLAEKVEELTLYLIRQHEEISALKDQISKLNSLINNEKSRYSPISSKSQKGFK